MNSKKLIIFTASLLMVVLLINSISALGISPGRTTVDFSPGLEKTITFSVVNSEDKDINVVLAVQGELKDYVIIGDSSFSMSSGETARDVSYTVKLPQEFPPGLHTAEIVVLQLPEEGKLSEAYIGAAVAVVTQLYVRVPYPGKYAEADLNVIGPESDGKITFVIPVLSRGEFDLAKVRAVIDVYSSLNEKIETLSTNEFSIPSRQREELVATWDASKIISGPYRAVATILYDEDTLSIEKQFNIGEKRLSLENVEVNDFSLGEIAKFEILVKNEWSEGVKGVYTHMVVYGKDGNVLADFKSPTHDISPLEKTLMVSFWDTKGVKEAIYDATLFLKYGENSEKQDLKLDVKENEINIIGIGYVISERTSGKGESNRLMIILIFLVGILILVNILWFLFFRRKLAK